MNTALKTFIRAARASAWARMCADRETVHQLESRMAQLAIDLQRARDVLARSEAANAAIEAQAAEIEEMK